METALENDFEGRLNSAISDAEDRLLYGEIDADPERTKPLKEVSISPNHTYELNQEATDLAQLIKNELGPVVDQTVIGDTQAENLAELSRRYPLGLLYKFDSTEGGVPIIVRVSDGAKFDFELADGQIVFERREFDDGELRTQRAVVFSGSESPECRKKWAVPGEGCISGFANPFAGAFD